MRCDNGKWKWGRRGECKYNSREECERANRGRHGEDVRADDLAYWEEFAPRSARWLRCDEKMESDLKKLAGLFYADRETLGDPKKVQELALKEFNAQKTLR
jgi:hypothetical protein